MTQAEIKNLKGGEKLSVSYKGIRPCTFKNIRGKCAYVEFDSGDGTGVRLHRVLATTLIKPAPKAPKTQAPEAKAPAKKAEAQETRPLTTKGMSAEQIIELAKALDTLARLGYEVQELRA